MHLLSTSLIANLLFQKKSLLSLAGSAVGRGTERIKAVVAGDEPPGLSVAKLRERLPARWDQQPEWLREK